MAGSKLVWTDEMVDFIKNSFGKLTCREMALHLQIGMHAVRVKYRELGFKAIDMEYWTEEQVEFLRQNFKSIGDLELSEIFQEKWKKNKPWTLKHIEKKRNYLALHRSISEINAVRKRNVDHGRFALCPVKAWAKRGVSKEGTVRYWKTGDEGRRTPFIKIKGGYVHYARWRYQEVYGQIPDGYNVVFADNDSNNLADSNLTIVTDAELSQRNSIISSQGLSDNYVIGIMTHGKKDLREQLKNHPELIELKRNQLKLQRVIKNGKQ